MHLPHELAEDFPGQAEAIHDLRQRIRISASSATTITS